jgi:hypothetical protein
MSNNTPKAIKYGIVLFLLLLGVGYVLFNSRIFIAGPQLTVISPVDGISVNEKKIVLEGNTFNTSFISVNDRAISVDEQGNFSVPILLQDGYNQVVIKAHDKFDRQVTQTLDLVYNSSNQLE